MVKKKTSPDKAPPPNKKTKKERLEEMPIVMQEAFAELEKKIKDKIKREIRSIFRDPEIMNLLLDNQSAHLTRFNKKTYTLFEKKVGKMSASLKEIEEDIAIMEETMRNVLLAIRQNEYLQAWYPAQQGSPEMKVVGSHPVQTERRNKRNANKHTG